MVAPIVEDLAEEFSGKLVVAKVNTDEHSTYAQRFGVQGIPTLIFFAGGHEVDRVVGALPKVVLRGKFQNVLSQLPAKVEAGDVLSVVAMGLVLSFLATIYPAWRAARLDPVEALRYE